MVVDTKLQTHVTPEMFEEGYKTAVEAMKGTAELPSIQELPKP